MANKFGRIVNITSGGVLMPQTSLEVSCAARAGLTAFLTTVARAVAPHNVTINFLLPGAFDTDRLRSLFETNARPTTRAGGGARATRRSDPGQTHRPPRRIWRGLRVPLLRACGLHNRWHNLLIDGGAFPAGFRLERIPMDAF